MIETDAIALVAGGENPEAVVNAMLEDLSVDEGISEKASSAMAHLKAAGSPVLHAGAIAAGGLAAHSLVKAVQRHKRKRKETKAAQAKLDAHMARHEFEKKAYQLGKSHLDLPGQGPDVLKGLVGRSRKKDEGREEPEMGQIDELMVGGHYIDDDDAATAALAVGGVGAVGLGVMGVRRALRRRREKRQEKVRSAENAVTKARSDELAGAIHKSTLAREALKQKAHELGTAALDIPLRYGRGMETGVSQAASGIASGASNLSSKVRKSLKRKNESADAIVSNLMQEEGDDRPSTYGRSAAGGAIVGALGGATLEAGRRLLGKKKKSLVGSAAVGAGLGAAAGAGAHHISQRKKEEESFDPVDYLLSEARRGKK